GGRCPAHPPAVRDSAAGAPAGAGLRCTRSLPSPPRSVSLPPLALLSAWGPDGRPRQCTIDRVMAPSVYLQTYGCQMNERDSEEILGMLSAQGFAPTDRETDADVILLNTCSVREHAEERAYGKMGALQALKREKPDLVLGVLGCMAKAQREAIFR